MAKQEANHESDSPILINVVDVAKIINNRISELEALNTRFSLTNPKPETTELEARLNAITHNCLYGQIKELKNLLDQIKTL